MKILLIKICVGSFYKILRDNDFKWISPSIISKIVPGQQKLKMNWCKCHKDRNWDYIMFSAEWTFYLKKTPEEMRSLKKKE